MPAAAPRVCGRRVALLLGEVAVTIHVHEPAPAGEPRAIQAPEQHAAVAADHHREAAGFENALHLLGQGEREGANGASVADAGAGLGLDLVQRPRQAQDFVGVERLAQPRLHQHARRLPGAGLVAVLRAKPEVGRREHDAHGRCCRRGGALATCAEEDCACDHAELPPGHAHGCCDSSPLTYNQYYIGYRPSQPMKQSLQVIENYRFGDGRLRRRRSGARLRQYRVGAR